MIEINLLPGSAKRTKRRKLAMPRLGKSGKGGGAPKLNMPTFDRTLALLGGAWIVGVGLVGYLHFSSSNRLADLHVEHEAAVADSANNAKLRAQGDSLAAQEAIIAQKLQLIQDIDAGRFTWSHILDELSRALPSYIWLVNITQAAGEGTLPAVRMEGRAGNYYALGKYIEDLESSPFLRGVRLLSSSRLIVDERVVLQFVLELGYETPPPDAIQTVPLFAAQAQGN